MTPRRHDDGMEQRHDSPRPSLVISCDTCTMRATDACDDCLVTALVDAPEGAVVFDLEEERAVRLLVRKGMVPTIRHHAAG